MSNELKFPNSSDGPAERDTLDERLVRLVRDAYAPPVSAAGAEAYWSGLEQRIAARVGAAGIGSADGQWWSVLGAWAQTGLIAAAAIFAVASAINQVVSAKDSQFVYESVIQPGTPEVLSAPIDLLSAPESSRSDAILTYVLSH